MMIYNLCDNAIKYNKDGGAVTVRVTEEEDQVVVSVEDTRHWNLRRAAGPGI